MKWQLDQFEVEGDIMYSWECGEHLVTASEFQPNERAEEYLADEAWRRKVTEGCKTAEDLVGKLRMSAVFALRTVIQIVPATPSHECLDNAVEYVSDGPLGHEWECSVCGNLLQVG